MDWETTGAIGLGIAIAASAASFGAWKITFERKAQSASVTVDTQATTQRRAQPRAGDPRRLRARPLGPGVSNQPNLPPGHPPLNVPRNNNPVEGAIRPAPGAAPVRPAPNRPANVAPAQPAPAPAAS